mmetsp:Transcript_26089/g.41056  ORF Transcript_26089/g.41056 Transcript_26089/m.41056 type:complete len:256 (-) Transcript_26089:1605-2372(-)
MLVSPFSFHSGPTGCSLHQVGSMVFYTSRPVPRGPLPCTGSPHSCCTPSFMGSYQKKGGGCAGSALDLCVRRLRPRAAGVGLRRPGAPRDAERPGRARGGEGDPPEGGRAPGRRLRPDGPPGARSGPGHRRLAEPRGVDGAVRQLHGRPSGPGCRGRRARPLQLELPPLARRQVPPAAAALPGRARRELRGGHAGLQVQPALAAERAAAEGRRPAARAAGWGGHRGDEPSDCPLHRPPRRGHVSQDAPSRQLDAR